jgi:imidazolonepropionase-like amidohydrolase
VPRGIFGRRTPLKRQRCSRGFQVASRRSGSPLSELRRWAQDPHGRRAFRTVEALAITNGRIVATGTSAEIARYAGKNTKVIDVAGATVIPGLIDNHFTSSDR